MKFISTLSHNGGIVLITQLRIFCKIFWRRFLQNQLLTNAGYLTYSTMLALVPLLMVVFSVVTVFPMFQDMGNSIQNLIFTNLTPSLGDAVQGYLNQFIDNSKQMSVIGIAGLVIVALMLIFSIDNTLNAIWPDTTSRPVVFSIAIYWMILTLGPMLLGVSIAISSYLFSLKLFNSVDDWSIGQMILSIVPFMLTWFIFTIIYTVVPNTKVHIRYTIWGGLLATILFTLGKQSFTWYITTFPSYHIIYGALATIPLLIVWIQLSWVFVLTGAQFSAVLEDMRLLRLGERCFSMQSHIKQNELLENEVFELYRKLEAKEVS